MVTVTIAENATFRLCCTLYEAGDTVDVDAFLAEKYRAIGVFEPAV